MNCCAFKSGTITEINKDYQQKVTYITFATDVSNIYTATILVASDSTLVMDKNYNEIKLSDLKVGDLIYAYHSLIMTLSLPPQTKALIIELK